MKNKSFTLYIAKTNLHRRMMRDVRTQFENANMQDWLTKLASCRTLVAIAKLQKTFEIADGARS
jgi:hypothetical protein